jgi:hypothetical protein
VLALSHLNECCLELEKRASLGEMISFTRLSITKKQSPIHFELATILFFCHNESRNITIVLKKLGQS